MVRPRKQLILTEAASLFREKGYLASNLRELARRAGIQGGSVYHHFASKQEILFQVMDSTMDDMIARLVARLSNDHDPAQRLRRAIHFHIEYHVADSDEAYITDDELRNLDGGHCQRILAKRKRYQQIFEELLTQGQRKQGWAVADVSLFARAIIQMCTGVARWYRKDGPMTIEQLATHYYDLLTTGLIPRGLQSRQQDQADAVSSNKAKAY